MRPKLNQIRALGDFADNVHWYIQFTTIPSGVDLNSDDINLRCESVAIPKRDGTKVSVQVRGLPPVHQPGLYIPDGEFTVTLFETVNNKISKGIQQLVEMNYTQGEGKAKTKADVEFGVRLVRMDREHNEIYEYTFMGVFLDKYEPGGELGSSGADVLKPTMTFSYDDFSEKALR
ncbi:MAG: hypothetical protein ACTTIS_00740 [Streptobacillus sp.]|jgi:hypothetical protein|nr:MAG TPA: baseplate wedge protein [Caudoviricetes sp.]DAP65226.1 MAG TPA: baseplate wedge protein [Caudoviricetes sp.]DAS83559.1 MAG TPA: baseplate wedge protein [Caudoviricetes sp.]DAY41678.1 MAG TPA: baseplate wedge protein [Caudoviricetes sp.]